MMAISSRKSFRSAREMTLRVCLTATSAPLWSSCSDAVSAALNTVPGACDSLHNCIRSQTILAAADLLAQLGAGPGHLPLVRRRRNVVDLAGMSVAARAADEQHRHLSV